jgi:5-methylcytosine-specific restriction protein A
MAELPPRLVAGGWVDPKQLPKGPNGNALCRRCSTEVTPPRRTFCSEACVNEWKIRTQPAFAKQLVRKRDDGICQICRRDCFEGRRDSTDYKRPRGLLGLFEMDHIVPVVEGGGACGLDNLRTLCIPCHRRETAKLAARRAEARKAAG